MTFTAFFAAWFVHLLAAASPGPTILMSARIGMTEGMRTGTYFSLGCGLGALFWALSAVFGLALLFQVAPTVLWGFKLAGGLFLLWIALKMWRHAPDPLPDPTIGTTPRSAISAFKLGLATQLANPKIAIFFGAVFVGILPADATSISVALLLAAICLNETACTILVARVFSFEKSRRAYGRFKLKIDRVFGGLIGLLGAKIALT
jgi:threonine/homoserine/homoserine lactone efflux protein